MMSLDAFLAFTTSLYGQATLYALCVAVVAFFFAAKGRADVDAALDGGMHRKPLGLLDLSHGDSILALETHRLVAPERLWTYDEAYLERFAQAAKHARVPRGAPALQYYIRAILRGIDLWFAVGLGAFAVLVDLAVSNAIVDAYPFWGRVAWIGACMGFVYAAADIAEDLKLASILERAGNPGHDAIALVDPGEAAAANMLTRVKFVSITLSGVGAAVFVVLAAVAAVVIRPPSNPAPEMEPVRVGAD